MSGNGVAGDGHVPRMRESHLVVPRDSIPLLFELALDEFRELANVFEVMVNGSEPDVGDLVDVFQFPKDVFSDALGSYALFIGGPFVFEVVDHGLDRRMVNITLVDRFFNTAFNFGPVVEFFFPGALRDDEIHEFHPFERREAGFAFFAFATAADGFSVFGYSGVDDFGIEVLTLWAAHEVLRD